MRLAYASTAAVSSPRAPPPRLSRSRSARAAQGHAQALLVAAADVVDQPRGGLRSACGGLAHLRQGSRPLQAGRDARWPRAAAWPRCRSGRGGARPGPAARAGSAGRPGRRAATRRRPASTPCARRWSRRARRRSARDHRAPGPSSSSIFSSSRTSRCWRSPTWRTARWRRRGRARGRARAPAPATHFGSSQGLTVCSAATSPPAFFTISCSASGALLRPSSRAKKAMVVSGGGGCSAARAAQVGGLPALDALDDHEAAAHGEGHGLRAAAACSGVACRLRGPPPHRAGPRSRPAP